MHNMCSNDSRSFSFYFLKISFVHFKIPKEFFLKGNVVLFQPLLRDNIQLLCSLGENQFLNGDYTQAMTTLQRVGRPPWIHITIDSRTWKELRFRTKGRCRDTGQGHVRGPGQRIGYLGSWAWGRDQGSLKEGWDRGSGSG